MWRAIYAAIFGRSAQTRPLPVRPVPAKTKPRPSAFAADFSVFQAAVKAVGVKSPGVVTQTIGNAPMTWRGDAHPLEARLDGVLVMTASVSISQPGFVSVVGESHYEDALQRAKCSRPGEGTPVFMATLIREPQNPFDANAVAVVIEPFGKVGYIGRDVARRFAPLIDAAAPVVVRCPAQLRGGSPAMPFLGVVLDSALATGARLSSYDPNHTPDYNRIGEYQQRSHANEAFVAETRSLEVPEREEAIRRYQAALQTTRDIEAFSTEHNLFPGFPNGGAQEKNVKVLDRLTTCLMKAGRSPEAVIEADRYFADFPLAATLRLATAVRKRVEKHR